MHKNKNKYVVCFSRPHRKQPRRKQWKRNWAWPEMEMTHCATWLRRGNKVDRGTQMTFSSNWKRNMRQLRKKEKVAKGRRKHSGYRILEKNIVPWFKQKLHLRPADDLVLYAEEEENVVLWRISINNIYFVINKTETAFTALVLSSEPNTSYLLKNVFYGRGQWWTGAGGLVSVGLLYVKR